MLKMSSQETGHSEYLALQLSFIHFLDPTVLRMNSPNYLAIFRDKSAKPFLTSTNYWESFKKNQKKTFKSVLAFFGYYKNGLGFDTVCNNKVSRK